MIDFFDVNIIAQRIKKRREELGLTQDDLAKLVGFSSRSSINKIENPQKNTASDNEVRDITIGKINIIAKALETSPLYITGIIDNHQTAYIKDYNDLSSHKKTYNSELMAADSGEREDVSFHMDEED